MREADRSIGDLEDRIARLSAQAERCRNVAAAAKATIAVGVVLIAVPIVSLVLGAPTAWVLGAAAVMGGIVLYGSNRSTLQALDTALRDYEALRIGLIDELNPRSIGAGASRPTNVIDFLSKRDGDNTTRPPRTLH